MEKTFAQKFKEVLGEKADALKKLFEEVQPIVESVFVDVKTADGAVLRIDGAKAEVGGKCLLVDANGANPAPDATYTLEDGTSITVMGGVIAEVSTAKEEAADPVEAVANPSKMDEELAKVQEGVKSITYKYEEVLAENKATFAKVEKLEAQNKAMFEILEKLAELPVDEATQTPANAVKKSFLSDFRSELKEIKANRKNK